ncbi:MAG: DUF3016 domain-containing protein [Nibricoccus sp.]
MKIKLAVTAALLAAVCAPVFPADPTAAAQADARVEVVYVNPEKFTDVKTSEIGLERDRDHILAQIKDFLVERATKQVPEGQKLVISISDIDLAGDFEPWRGPQFTDVRVVKDLYPPRVNLSFKLTDASGTVVEEGERQLRDLSFQMTATPAFSSDSLRYEKALLDNWLRDEFPKSKEAKQKK